MSNHNTVLSDFSNFEMMDSEALNAFVTQAKDRCIRRLLQALIRENLLSLWKCPPLPAGQNNAFIPLTHERFIWIESIRSHSLSRYAIDGNISLLKPGDQNPHPIENPTTLLEMIVESLSIQPHPEQWQRFIEEIINHTQNDALSLYANTLWEARLAHFNKNGTTTHLHDWVKQHENSPDLFFEQWVTQGHPYHPCSKTKLGLNPQEVMAYSPEFRPQVLLTIAAIHKTRLHIEASQQDGDYTQWFAEQFPNLWEQWLSDLTSNHINPEQYYPLPIHPWQAKHIIPSKFQPLLQTKQLYLSKHITLASQPTLSFRTVVATEPALSPHIKLPVAVQTTSAIRTVSAASTENGPKISRILNQILSQENAIATCLAIMPEQFGLHVTNVDDDTKRHLSVIYRENPNALLNNDEIAITIAALFQHSPKDHFPLLFEFLEVAGATQLKAAVSYFRHYASVVLKGYLALYLKYGIALEGHQQNTLAVFQQGQPTRMIARDFGGMRVHAESLKQAGFIFQAYPGSATICSDRAEARNKLLHTTYQYHLGEWVLALAQHFKTSEKIFWDPVESITKAVLNNYKKAMDPKIWEEDYQAILQKPWPFKALLRMRLEDISHQYIYTMVANPFHH